MRLPSALLVAFLAAAALAGCTAQPTDLDRADAPAEPAPLQGQQFEGEADAGEPAGSPGQAQAHGEPQRVEGPVQTGLDPQRIPGAYARQVVTITNDFGGADRGMVSLSIGAGSIRVLPGDGAGYRIEATLEGRGLTEADAQEQLSRLRLLHTDQLRPDGLVLETKTEQEPQAEVVPGIQVGTGGNAWSDLVVYLPRSPSYGLVADAGSGDIEVQDLRGVSFAASTGSGDILATGLNAGQLALGTGSGSIAVGRSEAGHATLGTGSGDVTAKAVRFAKAAIDTGSGSIGLEGIVDTLEADSGSGSITVDAHARRSGAYTLSSGSGSIDLAVLYGGGRAYRVTADTGSGQIDVDLPNSRVTSDAEDPRHVEAENNDFDDAEVRTVLELETGSGDITVTA